MSPADPRDMDGALTELRRATDALTRAAKALAADAEAFAAAIGTPASELERALLSSQARALGAMAALSDARKALATTQAHDPTRWGRP